MFREYDRGRVAVVGGRPVLPVERRPVARSLHRPAFTPDQLSVMHVQRTPAGAVFTRLRVDATGEFIDRWPTGFFAERAGELF
jgi:hypothetical protein